MYRLTKSMILDQLDSQGIAPSRALGQNFLVDSNIVDKIISLAQIDKGDSVVEVGPGLGSLTVALAEACDSITAVELDKHVLSLLEENLTVAQVADKVQVINDDAMKLDWDALLDGPTKLIANLPYNIATPLVLDLLKGQPSITDMLVMVQLEAGQRLASQPGSKIYGIPSVVTGYWAEAKVVARIPESVFVPQPRVESCLVRIKRREVDEAPELYATFENLVKTAFGKRRKMIRASIGDLVSTELMSEAGLDGTERPETLAVDTWVKLATLIA